MARTPSLNVLKKNVAVKLSKKEKSLFIEAIEEDVSFICPVRGRIVQRVLVRKFRCPSDLIPTNPKYVVKLEDDVVLEDEDFLQINVNQTLDLDPTEIELLD